MLLEISRVSLNSKNFSDQWILEKYDLLRERGEDLRTYSEEEYQKLMIFFCNCKYESCDLHNQPTITVITALGVECPVLIVNKQVSNYRQQVIATGCVYFKRFYARYPFQIRL